jgi:lysophospholipase L1-like esterase
MLLLKCGIIVSRVNGENMVDYTRVKRICLNLLVSLLTVVFSLALAEGGLRLYDNFVAAPSTKASEPPLYLVCDCPYVYQLNPAHPEINLQGLRDREYVIPKEKNTVRLLMLGDSVTYGFLIPGDKAYPKQLEQRLKRYDKAVEVINAGVTAYTAYNEWQYYLHRGRVFEPDIVVVALVMNDVVDPELHWNYTKQTNLQIPVEAIPNPDYHRQHIQPILEARKERALRVERFIRFRGYEIWSRLSGGTDQVDEDGWPTFITGEDSVSIKVWLDYDSPEWQWLRGVYDRLNQAVMDDGARLIVVVFPLAYQLPADYPYFPQELIQRYCQERGLGCLDLLPSFRKHQAEELYLDNDVWHLSERGHQLVAEELARYLVEQNFQ